MAIPRKGSRTIKLGHEIFRWYIRKKPTYSQGLNWSNLTLAVECVDDAERGTLLVDLAVSRPDNWIAPHQTAVTPSVVRKAIAAAVEAGWVGPRDGTFHFCYPLIRDRP
mgnify:CR=1 FL=1